MTKDQILNYLNPSIEDHIFLAWMLSKIDTNQTAQGVINPVPQNGLDSTKEEYDRIRIVSTNEKKAT